MLLTLGTMGTNLNLKKTLQPTVTRF